MDSPAPLDALAARLVGLWRAEPDWGGDLIHYIRFLEDLRYIGVFKREPVSIKWPWDTMRIWMVLEPNSVLRCSYKLGGYTWIRTFYFEGECLIIDVTTCQIEAEPAVKRKLYRCHRIAVQDLPEGAEEEFNKAMARPWL